jgi:uncharacterized membrane protein YbhN (UPF0104 family)
MRAADKAWVVLGFGLGVVALYALAHVQSISFNPMGAPFSALFMLKLLYQQRFHALFLPGGTAVLVRLFRLQKRTGQTGMTVLLFAFNRVFASGGFLVVTALAIALDGTFPWPEFRVGVPVGALALLAVVVALLLKGPPRFVRAAWLSVPLPHRIHMKLSDWARYPQALKKFSAGDIYVMCALALVSQIGLVAEQYCIARSVGLSIPPVAFGWIGGISMLCLLVPVSPNGLGVREAAMIAVMVHYAVPEEQAIAFSLLFYTVGPLAKGLIGGIWQGMDTLLETRVEN